MQATKKDVLDRIDSEASRIRPNTKLQALKAMVEDIFLPRESSFHWDLSKSVETVEDRLRLVCQSANETEQAVAQYRAESTACIDFTYEVGSFVTVNAGDDENDLDFWVGRVKDSRSVRGKVVSVMVFWYMSYGSGDIYTAKYRPWFVSSKGSSSKDTLWKDEVSVDTIHSNFPALTKERKLPIPVINYVRTMVSKRRSSGPSK